MISTPKRLFLRLSVCALGLLVGACQCVSAATQLQTESGENAFVRSDAGLGSENGMFDAGSAESGPDAGRERFDAGSVRWVQVVAGQDFTCGIDDARLLKCWGRGPMHGAGDEVLRFVPVSPVGLEHIRVEAVAAGAGHVCAVSETRALYCWGRNRFGEVGDGTNQPRLAPVPLLEGVTEIAAGGAHSCAVVDGGTLCWGNNRLGAVGDGTWDNERWRPVPISLQHVVQLAAGDGHTCARTSTGDVWCWGFDASGQTGAGPRGTRCNAVQQCVPSPLKVDLPRPAIGVSAGGRHSCAVLEDGVAVCWGSNDFGELGRPSGASSSVPLPISIIGSVSDIRAAGTLGSESTCLLASGRVWCFGDGRLGQLGSGRAVSSSEPVMVLGCEAAAQLSIRATHGCALCGEKFACWGDNRFGALGLGRGDGPDSCVLGSTTLSCSLQAVETPGPK